MTELQSQIEKVKGFERTKNVWRTKYSSTEFVQASRLNQALFGIPLNHAAKCQCIEDLFYYINNSTNEKIHQIQNKMNQKFKFKKDTVIMLHGMNETLTEHNLTDEKAVELLSKYPSHIGSFEEFPKDWKALAEAAKKPVKGAAKAAAKAEGDEKKSEETGKGEAAAAGEGEEGKGSEDLGADAAAKAEEKLANEIAAIKGKKKPELVKYVQKDKKKFPAAEWEELTRDQLADYIVAKISVK
jgi:hypothetical protein